MAMSGQKISRNPDIIFSDVDGEVLMMDLQEGAYFNLDSVGSRIWELLEAPVTMDTLIVKLTGEFNVSDEVCRTETETFLANMVDRKLVLLEG